jgi:hypothetical protein
MARTVVEYLNAICPTMVADPSYAVFVDIATDQTSQSYFGDAYYNYAIALRAAHEYTLAADPLRSKGESGLITAKGDGHLTIHYLHNMNRNSKSDLNMTHFGQRLLSLIRKCGAPISISTTAFTLDDGVIPEAEGDYL